VYNRGVHRGIPRVVYRWYTQGGIQVIYTGWYTGGIPRVVHRSIPRVGEVYTLYICLPTMVGGVHHPGIYPTLHTLGTPSSSPLPVS